MKNDHEVKLTVRLNTRDPRHRRALELLHASERSITKSVVDAVIAADEAGSFLQFREQLITMIHDTIYAALGGQIPAKAGNPGDDANRETNGMISDEAFDIADDFMSSL